MGVESKREWDKFWGGLPESARGGWKIGEDGRGKSVEYESKNIVVAQNWIKPQECQLLLNLCLRCEMHFGSGPFGLKQIAVAIQGDGAFAPALELIDCIRSDMMHSQILSAAALILDRRFADDGRTYPPLERKEHSAGSGSMWHLYLNSDFEGGQLFYPSRRVAVNPGAGTIVRSPIGIPCGVAPVKKGYQFVLAGMTILKTGGSESWG